MTFHAKRRDANESMIVLALRAVGATVHQLDGKGICDLLVGYQQQTYLIEVKNPDQACGGGYTRRGPRTKAQAKSFEAWTGSPIHEVVNADEALVAIGALRSVA